LTNDSGFITGYTETDPTVPAWAKAASKPTYTKSEVGLGNVDNKSSVTIRSELTKENVTDALGYTPLESYILPEAGSSLGGVKSGGDVTISSGVITVKDDSHNHTIANVDDLQATLDNKADKSEGAFYIEGSGTTDATAKTSTWVGTSDRITEYYDGLTIRYKIGIAGQSTVTLNINNLGAKTVYRFNTTKLTTQFPVGSIIHLVYHTDLNDGCWITNDYDANTNTQQRVYESSSKNVEYPITARYSTTTGETYYAEYGRYTTGVTLNPSTNTITATAFKGKLTGNADTATKATQDASGNVITTTYETKANVATKLTEVNSQISQLSENIAALGTQEDIVQQVIAALGTPVFGRVDEGNNIIFSGKLVDGTYTLKYENAEGALTEAGVLVIGGVLYKNILKESVDSDDSAYNSGQGWKADMRLNSSGAETPASGTEVTGFMPLTIGDVLRFANIKITGTDTTNTTQYIVFYNSTKTKIKHIYTHQFYENQSSKSSSCFKLDEDGYWKEYDSVNLKASDSSVDWSDLAFFRISAEEITNNSIITRNQIIE
jgi:hypothetical protein